MKKTLARTSLILAFIAAFGVISLSAKADIQTEQEELMMIHTEGKIAAAMFNYLDTEIERSQALLELEISKIDLNQTDLMEGKIQATLISHIENMILSTGNELEVAMDLDSLDKVQEQINLINRLISEINR